MYIPADRLYQEPHAQTDQVNQAGQVLTHFQSLHPSLLIPLAQAFVTGFLVGLVVFASGLVFQWARPWTYGLLTWLAVWTIAWFVLINGWRSVVYRLEGLLNMDLTGDGIEGEPQKVTVRVEVKSEDGKTLQFADLHIDKERLSRMAKSVLTSGSFAIDTLTGQGQPLSKDEYTVVRDIFLDRHWLTWKNENAHSQGLQIEKAGKAVLRALAEKNYIQTQP